jgi:hypothetical protein
MPEKGKPIFQHAPGSVVRARRGGEFIAFWQARSDLVKRGFRPTSVPLWRGSEPTVMERELVTAHCQDLQEEMLHWNRDRRMRMPVLKESLFDGSVVSLINCYVHDTDSPYRKLRYGSRGTYYQFLRVIERDYGAKKIGELKARDMLRWHENWTERGVSMSHALIKHFRGLLTFGKTILDDEDCAKLSSILSDMKFKMGQPRTSVLTAEQVNMIRARAHAVGLHSVALAQTIQFVGMLRQRDVIGQWVPLKEPGRFRNPVRRSQVGRGHSLEGVRRELRAPTRHVEAAKDGGNPVRRRPDVPGRDEVAQREARRRRGHRPRRARPPRGPTRTSAGLWRQLANDCGIPKNVADQRRAGRCDHRGARGRRRAATTIRDAATHSDRIDTAIYNRAARGEDGEGSRGSACRSGTSR